MPFSTPFGFGWMVFDREDGSYRIAGDFFLPPVNLTLTEAMALSVLGSQAVGRSQLPFLADVAPAVAKVRSQLPVALREEMAELDGHLQIYEARVSPQVDCEAHFRTIQQAVVDRRKGRCRYPDTKELDDGPFLFRPYGLFFGQRAWYAIGHSERRGAERTLKLNRFIEGCSYRSTVHDSGGLVGGFHIRSGLADDEGGAPLSGGHSL